VHSRSVQLAVFGVFAGTLLLGLPRVSQGQALSPTTPQSAQTDTSTETGAMSLGDLARMVRANKDSAPKATKVIDDENLPRSGGGISVVGSGTDRRAGGAPEKMTLLDFWASWCGPCRESLPDLKALQRTYRSDQLEVISVNEDKNENAGRSFAAESGMSWEVQFDPEGQTSRQYGVHAFPTFILMDSNGREVQRFVGEDPSEPLAGRIAPYMPKAPKGDS
jgi:thiol-disulfide isomerase/thioredoxin